MFKNLVRKLFKSKFWNQLPQIYCQQNVAKYSEEKHQFLIEISENFQENYKNLQLILDLLNSQNFQFALSCDLKIVNIIFRSPDTI